MTSDKPMTMNVAEAAQQLNVSKPKMYQIARRSDSPAIRLGGRTAVHRELFEQWCREQAQKGASA